MKSIKFSHQYFKFGHHTLPFEATLLQCFKVHYNELSFHFKKYDTTNDEMPFKLPKTKLIVLLLFVRNETDPFNFHVLTTIRRYTPGKWEYYKSLQGQRVRLERSF